MKNTVDDDDDDYYYSSSEDCYYDSYGIESSDLLETKESKVEKFEFKTVMYEKIGDYPRNFKRKEEMEIKDVVKEHTLPLLPAKALLKLRLVSKEWDEWIMSPFLALKQSYTFRDISGFFCHYLNNFSFNRRPEFLSLSEPVYGVPSPSLNFLPCNDFVIRSSCNGLLLCHGKDNLYYICNPVNKEYVSLPRTMYYHDNADSILDFEPSLLNMEANYRVISAVKMIDHPIVDFDIYSSKTKKWRRSATDCVVGDATIKSNGFYINGFAYWLTSNHELLAFDLNTEVVGILYLPMTSARDGILAERHGELCYVCANELRNNPSVLVFDFYSGMDMSLKCSITVKVGFNFSRVQVLAFTKNDVLFFYTRGALFSCRMGDQTATIVRKREVYGNVRFLPYVNSLVNFSKLNAPRNDHIDHI